MFKKYLVSGVLIVSILVGVVFYARHARGNPPALQMEPWKILGNQAAPVTIALFSDFACPYCNQIRTPLHDLLLAYPNDLKIQFKHFPLSIHPAAEPAAEASECAADQGKFQVYHDYLFDHTKDWARTDSLQQKLVAYALELGLDASVFKACLKSGIKKKIVKSNQAEGRHLFVSGTPTLLLNGRKVFTSHKLEYMKKQIEAAINEARL